MVRRRSSASARCRARACAASTRSSPTSPFSTSRRTASSYASERPVSLPTRSRTTRERLYRGTEMCTKSPCSFGRGRFSVVITTDYVPPAVWAYKPGNGGKFSTINRPTAGATHDKPLPVGKHPLQLYSLATPNGQKAAIMLEELLALGRGAENDAWQVDIGEGDQFGSGFVDVNPNSKIPAMVDRSGAEPVRVFESGAILLYLAEKFHALMPTDHARRTE